MFVTSRITGISQAFYIRSNHSDKTNIEAHPTFASNENVDETSLHQNTSSSSSKSSDALTRKRTLLQASKTNKRYVQPGRHITLSVPLRCAKRRMLYGRNFKQAAAECGVTQPEDLDVLCWRSAYVNEYITERADPTKMKTAQQFIKDGMCVSDVAQQCEIYDHRDLKSLYGYAKKFGMFPTHSSKTRLESVNLARKQIEAGKNFVQAAIACEVTNVEDIDRLCWYSAHKQYVGESASPDTMGLAYMLIQKGMIVGDVAWQYQIYDHRDLDSLYDYAMRCEALPRGTRERSLSFAQQQIAAGETFEAAAKDCGITDPKDIDMLCRYSADVASCERGRLDRRQMIMALSLIKDGIDVADVAIYSRIYDEHDLKILYDYADQNHQFVMNAAKTLIESGEKSVEDAITLFSINKPEDQEKLRLLSAKSEDRMG